MLNSQAFSQKSQHNFITIRKIKKGVKASNPERSYYFSVKLFGNTIEWKFSKSKPSLKNEMKTTLKLSLW
jgi:hypothetical protein